MGAALCKADLDELEASYCSGAHYCGIRDDVQDSLKEQAGSYHLEEFSPAVLEYEEACCLDSKVSLTSCVKPLRGHEYMICDTPTLPESFSDEEDGEEANPVHEGSDVAQVLQYNGDDKHESKVDSTQSNGMGASVLIVDLDSWERTSRRSPGAWPTLRWPEKLAMYAEVVREAIENVAVDLDAGTDDMKQTPSLVCLARDKNPIRSPCNISDATDSDSSVLSRRLHVPKVAHFLKHSSTCGSDSCMEEERSPCLQQITTDTNTESTDAQILDGVWMLDDGEHVAVVQGSDVKLLGDGADFSFQLQELGAGVWAITIDGEDFLADCTEREDGRLLLHWSDGLTWVRKEESTAIDSVKTYEKTLLDECQSISSSSSSSWSSSSSCSSSDSSPTAWSSVGLVDAGRIPEAHQVTAVGEAAELVTAAEASKASKTIDFKDFEDQVCKVSQVEKAWGVCVDNVSQARHPSKANTTVGAPPGWGGA